MLKLIVNGDDLGLCEEVNEGIKRAHLHGILTSASIMANGAAFEDAIRICRSLPRLDVGVHLTLVEEASVLEDVKSLVDSGSKLHRSAATFATKYMTGRIASEDVERELEAQVRKVRDRGVKVTHLDGHQHLHMLPEIFKIAVKLARKYGIDAIRYPSEAVSPAMVGSWRSLARTIQLMPLKLCCYLGRDVDVFRTDHFVGFIHGGNLNKQNLAKLIQRLPSDGTCELMCHPGVEQPDLPYGHWGYQWSAELEALTDPTTLDLVHRHGIQLTSYGELAKNLG
jgi:hopanoid biosynthesis associated protein HpnK